MSVSFTKESEDLFVVSVEGALATNELKEIQDKVSAVIDHDLETKILLLAEKFSGWAKDGGDWGSLDFMLEHDSHIKKIAVVTSESMKDDVLAFLGAGMRKASVEYFSVGDEDKARSWLH